MNNTLGEPVNSIRKSVLWMCMGNRRMEKKIELRVEAILWPIQSHESRQSQIIQKKCICMNLIFWRNIVIQVLY